VVETSSRFTMASLIVILLKTMMSRTISWTNEMKHPLCEARDDSDNESGASKKVF
jgi:hypothetical protein